MSLYRLLIVVFLCFCATSAFGLVEVIEPSAIGIIDQYDSAGSGATKTIRLTDGSESNYIFSPTADDSDLYVLGDLVATDIDVVDSLVLHVKAQDNGNGNNRIVIGIRIKTDTDESSTIALTTSWVDYSLSLTTPPGSRGTWDDFEVDSSIFLVRTAAIGASREVRVAICSVQVFYSSNERTLMTPEKDDACLTSLGRLFDHDLRRKSAMQNDTAFVVVDASTVTSTHWKTGDAVTAYHKMNNDDWETGGFAVHIEVVHVLSDCSLTVRIQRYNSSCALQESTPFFPASGAQILVDTTGHYEVQVPQFDWAAGACGDELSVQFRWDNPVGEAQDSVWILYGGADTYFEHEIIINGTGCGAEAGAGDCAGQPSTDTTLTLPDQEGGIAQFVNVGAAANLIAAISDAFPTDSANYMMEDVLSQQQEVQFAGISDPADLGAYDSITVQVRARRSALGGGQVRFRTQLQDSTDVSNECNDIYVSLKSITFVTFEPLTVTGLPSGGDACEGAITTAGINTLEAKFSVQALASGKEVHITNVDLIICYTIEGGANFRRIRMIKQMGRLDDRTIWDTYHDQTLRVEETYEISVTYGMLGQEWLWGG